MDSRYSVVILTKNEENNIVDCIESASFIDDIIIIDDFSQDRTLEILGKYDKGNVRIFQRQLENNFAKQRNFGLSRVRNKWALFVDADEKVSKELASELLAIPNKVLDEYDGFYIKRKDFMWGKWLKYGETGDIKLLRLAKKGAGKWIGEVHEKWIIQGHTGNLKESIYHYPHQTITTFLKKINTYTDIRAKELYKNGTKVSWSEIIMYPLGKFFLNYILKKGFMDRVEGFIFAVMMSLHSFLVRAKLWRFFQGK